MKSRALIVPRSNGEGARQLLIERGWLRSDLRIRREGGELWLPLSLTADPALVGGQVEERDFEEVTPVGPQSYRETVDVPDTVRELLPRSFDVIGDIVLIRLPTEVESYGEAVGGALLRFVPGARLVGWDQGVHGPDRTRRVVRLAGMEGWRTRHRENGLEIDVDVAEAYFSPRLAREHARVARAVQTGERVLDLCCGVGPFTLQIGRDGRAATVVAVDRNPAAIELLKRNLARLRPLVPVEVREGGLAEILPSLGVAERVVFNLPHEGIKYLTSVANAVARAGTLHYYEVSERSAWERRPEELVGGLPSAGEWTMAERHVVHPYSPASDLVAYTLTRGSR